MAAHEKKLSLRPLKFNEAVADLLKVKPPDKPRNKAKKSAKRTQRKRED
jgi:hypothetical protein